MIAKNKTRMEAETLKSDKFNKETNRNVEVRQKKETQQH
jgi:hypothetical protein